MKRVRRSLTALIAAGAFALPAAADRVIIIHQTDRHGPNDRVDQRLLHGRSVDRPGIPRHRGRIEPHPRLQIDSLSTHRSSSDSGFHSFDPHSRHSRPYFRGYMRGYRDGYIDGRRDRRYHRDRRH